MAATSEWRPIGSICDGRALIVGQAPGFCAGFRPGILVTRLLHRSHGVVARADAGRQPPVKIRDVLRLLHGDGWRLVVVEGSHRQFTHPAKQGRVTVAGHPSAEVPPGTLNSIMKKAGLR